MGFFTKKKIDPVGIWVTKIFNKLEEGNYHPSVILWSKICSVFIPDQMDSVNKIQGNIVSYESVQYILKNELGSLRKDIDTTVYEMFETAYRKLVVYYIFCTFEIGDNDFLKINKINKTDFINQLNNIFNLSSGDMDNINEFINKYGYAVKQKLTTGEYSLLKHKEIKFLVMTIYNSTGLVAIKDPTDKSIELVLDEIRAKRPVFNAFLQQHKLI